ncbi:hypothetical protein [Parasitella parasitica]|uniref:C3H1-type domain-containing protein n=1 Tax=Parasitella parasitica TaxID=35722 RepID=A0A0B7MUG0_9FUNG|nr:hypothetical protein [Parasitella parasitica]
MLGGVASVSSVTDVSSTTFQPFEQGIKTEDDYQKYLAVLQNTSEFKPHLFEPLFKTLDSVVLNSIGESQEFGKVMKHLADIACNTWNEAMIKSLLKIMHYLPLNLDVLIKNSLGFGVKDIKKNAVERDSTEIIELTNSLIEKWKGLQKKSSVNANGKRNSPDRSSSLSPPSSTEQPAKKQIKLAIQKEPPSRPKAMADPNFLSSLRESKKYPNTRPIYNVDKILEGFGNKYGKTNTISIADTTPFNSLKKPETDKSTSGVDSPKKKRVRFKDDLFEIREYEKNPEEWTNFDFNGKSVEHQYGNARDLDVKEGQNAFMHVPQIAWYTPFELQFDVDSPHSTLNVRSMIQTRETLAQDNREKLALAAIYTSPQHIPPSPGEPDEIPGPNNDSSVVIIPLDDVESFVPSNPVYDASMASPPPTQPASYSSFSSSSVAEPTIQPNILTDLNAAFAVIQEHNPSYLQQPQPLYNYPATNATVQVHEPSTAKYQGGPTGVSSVTHQGTVSPTTPPTVPGMLVQPEITSNTVDNILKNNPRIMQSLKKLSFLAGNKIDDALPQRQTHSQSEYQAAQPYRPYQHQLPPTSSNQQHTNHNNGWNRNNHNNEHTNNGKTLAQRKKNKTRGTRRGNRGSVKGLGRIYRSNVCNFYKKAEGCRRGEACPYSHEDHN